MFGFVFEVVFSIDEQLITVLALNTWHFSTIQADVIFNMILERLEVLELLVTVLAAEIFYLGTVNSIRVPILLSLLSVLVAISCTFVSVFARLVSQHDIHFKKLPLLHSSLQSLGYI